MARGIAFVGAVYIDTILTTPRYPERDSKLRATCHSVRRGGNTPNSLEILTQYADGRDPYYSAPVLVAALPAADSIDFNFIRTSLPGVELLSSSKLIGSTTQEAPRSYIIRDAETNSRTIVNYNALEEFSFDVLKILYKEICHRTYWWHFEGRNTEAIVPLIEHIRQSRADTVIISLEIEKPDRKGLIDVAHLCDFVFYSKSWATNAGFSVLSDFLESQRRNIQAIKHNTTPRNVRTKAIFCTWADGGSGAVNVGDDAISIHRCEAVLPVGGIVVDTIGAGDVFIGSMIAQLDQSYRILPIAGPLPPLSTINIDLDHCLEEANTLCGRKICQEGFGGLVSK